MAKPDALIYAPDKIRVSSNSSRLHSDAAKCVTGSELVIDGGHTAK